jgi:hypothetical protein
VADGYIIGMLPESLRRRPEIKQRRCDGPLSPEGCIGKFQSRRVAGRDDLRFHRGQRQRGADEKPGAWDLPLAEGPVRGLSLGERHQEIDPRLAAAFAGILWSAGGKLTGNFNPRRLRQPEKRPIFIQLQQNWDPWSISSADYFLSFGRPARNRIDPESGCAEKAKGLQGGPL